MAWNPSPKVKEAQGLSKKFGNPIVIILSITENGMIESVSYGKTKELCEVAKKISAAASKAVVNYFES